MKGEKISKSVVISAIAGLVILEITAMRMGINGRLYAYVIAIIAGLAGASLPQIKFR